MYPHGVDCLSVLVPVLKQRDIFIFKVARYNATTLIIVTFLMIVVARVLIQRAPISNWFPELLITFGICLAQRNIKSPKSSHEFCWIVSVLLFAFAAVAMLSTILYQSLVLNQYLPEIDTIEQLAASDLNIFMTNKEPVSMNR